MNETPDLMLADHLKKLKLPTVLREYEKQARQCAAENKGHVPYLSRLIELELIDRERRMVERLNRPLFAGDPEVRILGYGKEEMWKQIFTRSARTCSTDGVRASGRI